VQPKTDRDSDAERIEFRSRASGLERSAVTASGLLKHVLHLTSVTCGLQCLPQRPTAAFAVAFLNFAGREELRMIRKLRPPELLVTPSLVFTMQSVGSVEHTSRYGPARPRMKRRHTLRFRVGKGEARAFDLPPGPSPYQPSVVGF